MKIASVLGYLSPRYGGPPNTAINLGLQIEKYGADRTWWATATKEEQQELSWLKDKAFLYEPKFPISWHRSSELHRKLVEHINEIDLFHLHQVWDYPVFVAARAANKFGKPYLLTPHGIFSQPWRYKSIKKSIYLKLIARPFLKRASCIHAVCPEEISGFERIRIGVPFTVIPNGVAVDEFRNLPPRLDANRTWPIISNRPLVLFLGRFSPEKGLDILVEAWRLIVKKFPRALLMIAGPDQKGYKKKIEALIKQRRLNANIFMPGMLDAVHKKMALSRADIYVQPSYSEGFSNAVLEALCSRIPCVVTKGCNFPEISNVGAGAVVEPIADALGASLVQLLSLTDKERYEIGEKGQELIIRRYTWDIAARKMLIVYKCILEGRAIPLFPDISEQ
jgi:glycosyltransferase involved in cell wall biosynthesis